MLIAIAIADENLFLPPENFPDNEGEASMGKLPQIFTLVRPTGKACPTHPWIPPSELQFARQQKHEDKICIASNGTV